MKKSWSFRLGLLAFLFSTGAAHAIATAPGISKNHNNYLGEVLRGQITKDFPYHTAATVGFEAGYRNYRATGTFGWEPVPCQRVKITGEYLTQNIDYNFYSGVSRQWVQQGAVGVDYQYALNDCFQDYLSLSGWYSHAPSVDLSTRSGSFVNSVGGIIHWTDLRRIAGSNAGGLSPAITTHLWQGNEATLALNWDDVVYDNIYQPKKRAEGFGGTASMSQLFQLGCQNFKVGASAALRTPFNYFEGEVDWIKPFPTSSLLVGVFGGYTHGKFSLPSTGIAGVNVSYAIDTPTAPVRSVPPTQTFLAWMGKPAVRMPQVLAIVDESVTQVPQCRTEAAPVFTGTIVNQDGPSDVAQTFNSPSQFSGTDLTYTVTSTKTGGGTSTVTINSTTGAVTVTGLRSTTHITITATDPCGHSVSSNTFNAVFS
ncbi:MAG: hypothetical protein ACYCQI_03530 [Gammaproteobacteria bacterium]